MSHGAIEPKAELRQAAVEIFSLFTALVQSGFTETQALVLVAEVLKTNTQ